MPAPVSLTRPWAIREADAAAVYRSIGRGLDLAGRVAAERERIRASLAAELGGLGRDLDVRDGVAIIRIRGTLFAEDSLFSWLFGGSSYPAIGDEVRAALGDTNVHAILLDVDSPGGEVDGCSELAGTLFEARGQGKEIVAYCRGMCASAAYWIGSAADRVIAADTSLLGSIGVLIPVLDDSAWEEKAGFKTLQIISSSSPKKRSRPVDDAVIARYQRVVDDTAEIFVASVARHRRVTTEAVVADFGEGDVLIASRAVDAGLADAIGTFEGTLAELAASRHRPAPARDTTAWAPRTGAAFTERGSTMPKDAKSRAAAAGGADETEDKAGGSASQAAGGGDDDKKDVKAEDTEMVECPNCEEGKQPDGSKCETCGGTAKVAQKVKAEGDDKDDDDDEKDDNKDRGAMAEFRAALGVGPRAGATAMYRAFAARFVPADRLAATERKLAELSRRDAERSARENRTAAERFADDAIAQGRQFPDKRDVLVEDYIAAEDKRAGSGPARVERLLLPKGHVPALKEYTRHGDPPGGRHGGTDLRGERGGGMASVGTDFDRAVKTEMQKNPKLDYSAAMDVVAREQPHLYEQSRQ